MMGYDAKDDGADDTGCDVKPDAGHDSKRCPKTAAMKGDDTRYDVEHDAGHDKTSDADGNCDDWHDASGSCGGGYDAEYDAGHDS